VLVKLVFVSHATVDSDLVEQFVDMILKSCGLTEADIFVSSIPGMDIPAGSDLLAAVRAEVSDTTLVIAVITPTYPTRPVCVAELGAAWGVAGKLLPVLVPGIDRDRLDGVLTGMKVDYLDQEKALDHIAERIETETGRRPANPAGWTRAKQKWLGAVDELVAALPTPQVISKDEHDELKAKLAETKQALADAETEVTTLKQTIEQLKAAKDAAEVTEILLPADDIERFEALREKAIAAIKGVAPIIQEAIRCRLSGDAMRWPDPMEDPGPASAAENAVTDGLLIDTGNGLDPNGDHGPVRRAIQAVDTLASELDGQAFEPEFYEWFKNRYDGPPELGQRVIWRSVFPPLIVRH
jgi:TIR domain